MTSMSVLEVKRLADGGDDVMAVRMAGLRTELRDGAVRDLVDDAAGESFDRFLLLRSERAIAAAHALKFSGADLLELLLEAHNRRRHLGDLEAGHHPIHFLTHQMLGVVGFLHALSD